MFIDEFILIVVDKYYERVRCDSVAIFKMCDRVRYIPGSLFLHCPQVTPHEYGSGAPRDWEQEEHFVGSCEC